MNSNLTVTNNTGWSWLNLKGKHILLTSGAWITNLVIIYCLRVAFSIIPGTSPELSWTLTLLTYDIGSFIMFHGVIGTPFDFAQNECGNLTLWEQLDNETQFTPTKKYLTAVPVILYLFLDSYRRFLLSTHYTNYDQFTFLINLISTLVVVIAKLPVMHRVRLFGINKGYSD